MLRKSRVRLMEDCRRTSATGTGAMKRYHLSLSEWLLARCAFSIALRVLLFVSSLSAHAQLVPDGGTATVNGTSINVSGALTVGTNGNNTTLIVTNAGMVTNTGA